MSEPDIVRKIRAQIADGFSIEAQVVYFMVKVRKLLDIQKPQPAAQYRTLRLCCNWAVHVELDQGFAEEIVKKADAFLPKLLSGSATKEQKEELRNILNLQRFRDELNQFLIAQRIEAISGSEWNRFLTFFLNTIEDCPLICKSPKTRKAPARKEDHHLKEVDKVVLLKKSQNTDRVPDGSIPEIVWELYFAGERKFTIQTTDVVSDETIRALVESDNRRKAGPPSS